MFAKRHGCERSCTRWAKPARAGAAQAQLTLTNTANIAPTLRLSGEHIENRKRALPRAGLGGIGRAMLQRQTLRRKTRQGQKAAATRAAHASEAMLNAVTRRRPSNTPPTNNYK